MCSMNKLKLAAVAALAAASCAANATTLSTPVTFDTGLLAAELNNQFTLPTFNPALGTLSSVIINETGRYVASGTVSNPNFSAPQSGNVLTRSLFQFSTGVSALDALLGQAVVYPTFFQGYSGIVHGGSASFGGYDDSATSGDLISSDAAILALFQGGPLTLNLATVTSDAVIGGHLTTDITAHAQVEGIFSIQFGYEPGGTASVPEPATFALFGVGLAGFGAARRRRG